MGKGRYFLSIAASALVLGLAGCDDSGQLSFTKKGADTSATSADARPSTTRLVEQDVEAPEVFDSTEAGLWDGRPSLGGVWVAHPGVKDPERVIIRNKTNGKFVIGALFKRERDNPGPRFQVSSDAAAALGLLAGGPAELNVTALRRKEVAPAPTAAPAASDLVADGATTDQTATADPTAVAAAPEAAAEPKKKWRGLFGRKNKKAEDAEAITAAAPKLDAPEAIQTTQLSPLKAAEAAIDKAESSTKTARRDAASAVITPATQTPVRPPAPTLARAQTAAPVPAVAPKPIPKLSGKPFVQIGYFSVEQNAKNTAQALRQAGIVPTVRAQTTKGKKFWRVLAGPATTAADRNALLKKIKGLGFQDAYFVTN